MAHYYKKFTENDYAIQIAAHRRAYQRIDAHAAFLERCELQEAAAAATIEQENRNRQGDLFEAL